MELKAEPNGLDFAVKKKLADDALGRVDGNRKADALSAAPDCDVDSDEASLRVQQRSAGIGRG